MDLRSRHRVWRYGVDVEALDEIAESALVLDDETEVYLVDEIGKMECFSERFCTALTPLYVKTLVQAAWTISWRARKSVMTRW